MALIHTTRRKGILTAADHERRLKFARGIKREYTSSLQTQQVAFSLDGVSFVHKYKPANQARSTHGRIWPKPEEGLRTGCMAKWSHCGSGGRMAKVMVAISYREGVDLCEQYDKLDRHYFKDLVKREFGNMFKKANKGDSKLWIQDGDPSQNNALACCSWLALGAKLLSIPPRSQDINPIENFFKPVKDRLTKDAIMNNITWESFTDFSKHVRETILSMDKAVIDKIIEHMNKRIDSIITSKKGGKTKHWSFHFKIFLWAVSNCFCLLLSILFVMFVTL